MVVSLPATTMRKRKATISSSVSLSPSISASSRAEVRSSCARPAALVDHLLVVDDEAECGLHPLGRHVVDAVGAVEDQVGQATQLGPIGEGHPDQFGDHVHRHLAGEVVDEVEAARLEGGLAGARG